MMSNRCILSVRYAPDGPRVAKRVGGFLRYVQFRDHHPDGPHAQGVKGLVRYVAYRDQASPQARLFDREATIGDRQRRDFLRYVGRSLQPDARASRRRAVYQMVLSPEDARGLDLRAATRQVIAQLERDVGPGGLPPWIAAVHRNTAHPHVHIVLAAQREVEPGRFKGLMISRQRLARMKLAMTHELERQRGERKPERSLEADLMETARPHSQRQPSERIANQLPRHDPLRWRRRRAHAPTLAPRLDRVLKRAAARYLLEAEREAARRGRDWEMDR